MKEKSLHILFLDFDDIKNPLLGAGQARATLEVGKRLIAMGHQVTVLCSRYPGSVDRVENGLRYLHIGFGSANIRLNNIFYILSLPFSLWSKKADIIVECFTAPISTLFTPLFTRIPVVGLPTCFDAKRFSKLYKLPFHLVERLGCRVYSYFLPYTPEMDERMKKINPTIISKVVPEGVGEEFFTIEQKKPEYILFLGRLDLNQKGIDLLLHAYKKITQKTSYPLVIAGNGPDEEKVKALIQKLGLSSRVTMTGPTFGKMKDEVLSKALFVAFPSRNEGFSLFSLEAIASGLPLVGFAIPGLSWTNASYALKATPFSIDQYARLLLQATDPAVILPMRKAARKEARKYTWENVANQFAQFFQQIVRFEEIVRI